MSDFEIEDLIQNIKKINLEYDINKIIKIQSHIRLKLTLLSNKKNKDYITVDILQSMIEKYNEKIIFNNNINKLLLKKKIRNDNFPSEISENIAKYAIYKRYNIMPRWDIDVGDLLLLNKKIEVKGFMSEGPSSFGPNENWNILCFVDCKEHLNNYFKIYLIDLSNKNMIWKNIKVNKNETFEQQCLQKRRPRICFYDIQKQIKNHCKLIFEGTLENILK